MKTLSPLESDIMSILWPDKQLKVREIYALMVKRKKSVALTSIAVALDRLHAQGIVDRTVQKGRGGLRYVYTPQKSKKEFDQSVLESAVNKLIDMFGPTAVAYFNERFRGR